MVQLLPYLVVNGGARADDADSPPGLGNAVGYQVMARERETQEDALGNRSDRLEEVREGKQVVADVGHSVKNTTDHIAALKKEIQARELAAQAPRQREN